jgi:hypothetical protein
MSEDEKIHVDVSRPATLYNGAVSTDFPTLQDAIMAWHRPRPEHKLRERPSGSLAGSFTRQRNYESFSMGRGSSKNREAERLCSVRTVSSWQKSKLS